VPSASLGRDPRICWPERTGRTVSSALCETHALKLTHSWLATVSPGGNARSQCAVTSWQAEAG
jgi:hypothetical protein